MTTPIYDATLAATRTEEPPMPATPEQDAAEDAQEQAASEALLSGAPSIEASEIWTDLTAYTPEEDDTRHAVELVTGHTKPDVLLTVAADLYSTNPDAAELRGLDPLDYVDVVIGMAQAEAMDIGDARRAARQLRTSLMTRVGSRADAATFIWERLGAEAQANMGVADPKRLTSEDMNAIEAYATGADGVGVAETNDGYWLVYDETV